MKRKTMIWFFAAAVLSVSLACGQISVGVEQENPADSGSRGNEVKLPAGEPGTAQEQIQETVESEYWTVVQDPNHGFRFAIPCYWRVDFPDYPGNTAEELARFSYSLYNYPEDYPLSFPRSHIPEGSGEVKVDFRMISLPFLGLPNEIGLSDYLAWEDGQFEPDDTTEIVLIDPVELSGTDGVMVTVDDSGQAYKYYLVRISPEFLMSIYVYPSSKIFDSPDLSGILNSITIDPSADVRIPAHTPAAPPIGVAAPCVPEYAQAVEPIVELSEENTACGLYSFSSLEYLTGKVAEYLQARNTGGLRWEYFMNDPFVYRTWGGEIETISGDNMFTKLANELYDAAEPGEMSFTSDQAQFPPLGGALPETLLGPGVTFVEVIYSEGWGLEQQGAALLYFSLDECGGYRWYGMVFSPVHFDK